MSDTGVDQTTVCLKTCKIYLRRTLIGALYKKSSVFAFDQEGCVTMRLPYEVLRGKEEDINAL